MINKQAQVVGEILKKEYNLYTDLLELSKKKKDIIIQGKVSELDKIIKYEQNMIFDVGQLEKQREDEIIKMSYIIGLERNELTVSELAKRLEPRIKMELEKLQKSINELLAELKTINDLNGELIKQSLEYIDFSINVITSAGTMQGSLYEDMDEKNRTNVNKKHIFDTKV